MIGKVNRLAKVAASASLVAGAIMATAGPAAAASPNSADGAAATGLIALDPVAPATYPGTSPNTVATLNVANLITTGVITDTADATTASSTIADPAVTLSALATVRARAITSSCAFDPNTDAVTGTATLANARVAILGAANIALDANPAPNTGVDVPGVASIVLNQQTTAADGTLTVNAIAITLLGSTQTVTVGTSVCNAASLAPVPVLPGMALPIGLGALGLFGLGGLGFVMTRRRRAATVA
ncbi:MAG TPA: choice-of-anchor P family protein [Streptosporangiaceae bacterium]|jgi:hypothetical protein